MRAIHIYRAPYQPATRFAIHLDGQERRWIRCSPRRPVWTDCCRKRRWAKYVRVQVYYDQIARFCKKGCGCKA